MANIFNTRGIVLRAIKYGETSLVISIFTEKFGLQTYLVNGVRSARQSSNKAALYQPGAILELQVYHNELKAMQRIKEAAWAILYKNIFNDVIKNSVAVFCVELLTKLLKQPEPNEDLFYFTEDIFNTLDNAEMTVTANLPLFFSLHLSHFFGLRISDEPKSLQPENELFLDLSEGKFTRQVPEHQQYLQGDDAVTSAIILKMMQPGELTELQLNRLQRRTLLQAYINFYKWHINDFGEMKTLKVLGEMMG